MTGPLSSPKMMTSQTNEQLREENRLLKLELNRCEDVLASVRAERDEIGIRYNAVSERLEAILKTERGGLLSSMSADDPTGNRSLMQQNIELRRRLEEEHTSYKRKLQGYQDAQQRQAQLVQRLQAKVLQYKNRCSELEEQLRILQLETERVGSRKTTLRSTQENYESDIDGMETSRASRLDSTFADMDLETALLRLEEEQQRSSNFNHVIGLLREQLDQATVANQALTGERQKLLRLKEEYEMKEAEWKKEEQSFNDYYTDNHNRLLHLWRSIVDFRRQFADMKAAAERDLAHMKAELIRASQGAQNSCVGLGVRLQNFDAQNQACIDRERTEKAAVEAKLHDKSRELGDLQNKLDGHHREFNNKLNDLTLANEKLKLQLEDRERTIARLEKLSADADEWRQAALEARIRRAQLPNSQSLAFAVDDLDAADIIRRRRRRDVDYSNDRPNEFDVRDREIARQRNEVDRGYEILRRLALQTLLQDNVADVDDYVTSAAATNAGRSQPPHQRGDPSSLSPPSQRRGHRRNVSDAAAVFDTRSSMDGLASSEHDRFTTGRSGSKSPGRGTSTMADLGGRGLRSLSPSQAATISSMLAAGGDQTGTSTLSIIQAAINRQRTQATELKASLDVARDENASLRKQLDAANAERRRAEMDAGRIQEERDGAARSQQQAQQMGMSLRKSLETATDEIRQLERTRQSLVEQLDGMGGELQRLQIANSELQKQRDVLEDEKEDVIRDLDRQLKENERCRRLVEQSEDRVAKFKEELVTARESLGKVQLQKDVMKSEKEEAEIALRKSESQRAELEMELNRQRGDEANMKDAIHKLQILNDACNHEKNLLNKVMAKLENEKMQLIGDKMASDQERAGLREELLRVEQEKMDLETEKSGLLRNLDMAETTQRGLEAEIRQLNLERSDLIERFNTITRQKNALADEVVAARRETERNVETIARVNKEKESLTKSCAELVVQLTAAENEARQHSETIAAMNSDKQSLESTLYQLQQDITQIDSRRQQLEMENQEMAIKQENMNGELNRVRQESKTTIERIEHLMEIQQQKSLQAEKDLQIALQQEKMAHEEDVEKLIADRDRRVADNDNRQEQLAQQFAAERDEIRTQFTTRINELYDEVARTQRDRDERLIFAETEKQQALSLADQERSALQERLLATQRDAESAQEDFERQKRDLQTRISSNQSTIANLETELKNMRNNINEMTAAHEKEVKDLNYDLREAHRRNEMTVNEISELKVQMKILEENRDNLRHDILEANRKLREADEQKELLKSEINDLRRAISQEQFEKEAVHKTANDLRNMVKKAESDKVDLNRLIQEERQKNAVLDEQAAVAHRESADLRASLHEVEKDRLEGRRELQDARRQMKQLDAERSQLAADVEELRARLARDEERDNENRKDIFVLKQKIVETEVSRDAVANELTSAQRKIAELDNECRLKENEYRRALDDSRSSEKALDDERHRLIAELEAVKNDMNELNLKLTASNGRVGALEDELERVNGIRRQLDVKLTTVVSTLRRSVGLARNLPVAGGNDWRPANSRSRSPSPTGRRIRFDRASSKSPVRRPFGGADKTSPMFRARSGSSDSRSTTEVDSDVSVDTIRDTLRDLVQQLVSAQRDRDDAATTLRSITNKLNDVEQRNNRLEEQVQHVTKCLHDSEEEKRDINKQLSQAHTTLAVQEESIRKKEREQKLATDTNSNIERQLSSLEAENRLLQDQCEKMKATESRLEDERKQLRLALDDAENRATRSELLRCTLEGDVQRLRLAVSEREAEHQATLSRVDSLTNQLAESEEAIQSVQTTASRLSSALSCSEEEVRNQKEKIRSLTAKLSETSGSVAEAQDRIQELQRNLSNNEQERRLIQDRLDSTRHSMNEAKKQNHSLLERLQSLQNEISDGEIRRSEVESQLKQANVELTQRQEAEQELLEKVHKLHSEKQSLQESLKHLEMRLAGLDNAKLEAEKAAMRLEKDKTAMLRTLEKVEREKLAGDEVLGRSMEDRSSLERSVQRLEEENAEIRRELKLLQAHTEQLQNDHSQTLSELEAKYRRDLEQKMDYQRTIVLSNDKQLEARDRANRHRIKSLEDQIQTLKNELEVEIRKRQQYISRGIQPVADVAGVAAADNRFAPVSSAAGLSTSMLDLSHIESKKLADDYQNVLKHHLLQQQQQQPMLRHQRGRSTARRSSPVRAMASAIGFPAPTGASVRAASTHRVPISPVLSSRLT